MALWSAVLLAVLKAMGQNAHLWKTWQCRSWMWLFSKAKVKWTTPQWMHLDNRCGGCGGSRHVRRRSSVGKGGMEDRNRAISGTLPLPLPRALSLLSSTCTPREPACRRLAQCSHPGSPKPNTQPGREGGRESPLPSLAREYSSANQKLEPSQENLVGVERVENGSKMTSTVSI